jgi:hypothetical protein
VVLGFTKVERERQDWSSQFFMANLILPEMKLSTAIFCRQSNSIDSSKNVAAMFMNSWVFLKRESQF